MNNIGGVSFLGQSQTQSARLLDLQRGITDLQRQTTTRKKHETLSGFGASSKGVLRYRSDISNLTTYTNNIDIASSRIKVMNTAMASARKVGEDLVGAIGVQVIGGKVDIEAIRVVAKSGLEFLQTLINTQADERYVFAGSAVDTPPLENRGTVNLQSQGQLADWKNGTISTSQLITNMTAMSATDIGFSTAMGSSGPVSIRIDQSVEINYEVIAPDNGFDKLMKALSFAANLEIPDEATDVPDMAEFTDVLLQIENLAREGIKEITSANSQLSSTYAVVDRIGEQHTQEKAVLQGLLDTQENADPTETLLKLQSLQLQLEAAYQVTSTVSRLSLVNFI